MKLEQLKKEAREKYIDEYAKKKETYGLEWNDSDQFDFIDTLVTHIYQEAYKEGHADALRTIPVYETLAPKRP